MVALRAAAASVHGQRSSSGHSFSLKTCGEGEGEREGEGEGEREGEGEGEGEGCKDRVRRRWRLVREKAGLGWR